MAAWPNATVWIRRRRKSSRGWLRTLAFAMGLAACGDPKADLAVGTLEMVEVDVGPLQVARAVSVLVQEGDEVAVGDTLARFSTPTLSSSAAQAEARTEAARQGAAELERGPRPAERARAEAELRAAESDAERTAADVARLTPLVARGDISRLAFDAAQAAARSTAARRDAAREALRLLNDGARVERRAAAAAEVRGAEAAAAAWRATAADLILLAPVAGVVTSRNVEPGEVLTAGQSAITLGRPERPWARLYVSQFVLPRLTLGDSVDARLDRDTTVYRGRVVSIASRAEFTPRVALTEQEREDLLFGVKVEFNDPAGRLKAGVPITVTLPPRGATSPVTRPAR